MFLVLERGSITALGCTCVSWKYQYFFLQIVTKRSEELHLEKNQFS